MIAPAAPFRLELTAWALRRRRHNQIDRFDAGVYRRAVTIADTPLVLSVTQHGSLDAPRLAVTLSDGQRLHAGLAARGALDRLLGLTLDLSDFAALAADDPALSRLACELRGLKPPLFPTVFEALVNAIACQQLSLSVGIHVLNRLTAARGRPVAGDPGGIHAFPAPEDLASTAPDELRALGFSTAKARAILGAATAIVGGTLNLEALANLDNEAAIDALTRLPGVGRWSAEYVLLRGLGRLHVFPADDVGARNTLGRLLHLDGRRLDYEAVTRLIARWHPYAGLVYFHLLLDSLSKAGLVTRANPDC